MSPHYLPVLVIVSFQKKAAHEESVTECTSQREKFSSIFLTASQVMAVMLFALRVILYSDSSLRFSVPCLKSSNVRIF